MSAIPNTPGSKPQEADKPVQRDKPYSEITTFEKLKYAGSEVLSLNKIAPSLAYKPEGWSPAYIESLNTKELNNKKIFGISVLTALKFAGFALIVGLFLAFAILVPPAGMMAMFGVTLGGIMQAMSISMMAMKLLNVCYKLILLKTPKTDQRLAINDTMIEMAPLLLKKGEPNAIRAHNAIQRENGEKAREEPKTSPKTSSAQPQAIPETDGKTPELPPEVNQPVSYKKPLTKATASKPAYADTEDTCKKTVEATRALRNHGTLTQNSTKPNPKHETAFNVVSSDPFSVVHALRTKNIALDPAILYITDEKGRRSGYEGLLCAQSDLGDALDAAHTAGLASSELIYAPNVLFYSDAHGKKIEAPFRADVIACPATDCRSEIPADHKEKMKMKMRALFRAAIERNKESLVLTAFGSEQFKNDPLHISSWYREVLEENEFKGRFQAIIFAVRNDHAAAFKSDFPDKTRAPAAT